MRQSLGKEGLWAFAKSIQGTQTKCPRIASEWHVANVAPADRRPDETTHRDFGLEMARTLEIAAQAMQETPTGHALLSQTILLMELSEWFGRTEGYGNLFLARRCLDLSTVGLCRLASDGAFPLPSILPFAARLRPSWLAPETRMRVLNSEAGAPIFGRNGTNDLEKMWSAGWALTRVGESERRGLPPQSLTADAVLADNRRFFLEEGPPDRPATLVSSWATKWHFRIVQGLELRSSNEAAALLELRRRLGAIPTGSNPRAIYPGDKGAFDEAWRATVSPSAEAFSSSQEWNSELVRGLVAWRAYDKVRRGVYYDTDLENTILYSELRNRRP